MIVMFTEICIIYVNYQTSKKMLMHQRIKSVRDSSASLNNDQVLTFLISSGKRYIERGHSFSCSFLWWSYSLIVCIRVMVVDWPFKYSFAVTEM